MKQIFPLSCLYVRYIENKMFKIEHPYTYRCSILNISINIQIHFLLSTDSLIGTRPVCFILILLIRLLVETYINMIGSEEIQSMHLAEAFQYRPKLMMG